MNVAVMHTGLVLEVSLFVLCLPRVKLEPISYHNWVCWSIRNYSYSASSHAATTVIFGQFNLPPSKTQLGKILKLAMLHRQAQALVTKFIILTFNFIFS